MRLLVTIPHYVRPAAEGDKVRTYGSLAADSSPRLHALPACLPALHQLFNPGLCFIHQGRLTAHRAEAPATSNASAPAHRRGTHDHV